MNGRNGQRFATQACFKRWTICQLRCCTDGLLFGKNEIIDQLTDNLFACGQNISMGIEVRYLQSKAYSPTKLHFKHNTPLL